MTGAFLVSRRSACLRVLVYLAITFTLGFAAGRVSASSPAAKAIPATSSGSRGESNTLTAELGGEQSGYRHSRLRWLASESQGGSVKAAILGGGPSSRTLPGPRIGRLVRPGDKSPTVTGGALRGTASWYPANGLIAAVNSWRWHNRPYFVTVCASSCIVVTVQDYCAGCTGSRLIDLSDDAFRLLAPLSQGVLRVEVRR